MTVVLNIAGIFGLFLFVFSLYAMKSDIQLTIAFIGLFAALICFGLSKILQKLN